MRKRDTDKEPSCSQTNCDGGAPVRRLTSYQEGRNMVPWDFKENGGRSRTAERR